MKPKVLFIDDDKAVLEALYEVYSDSYEVILATSGLEALSKIAEHPDIAAIVLDIRMARMDGFETASRLRKAGCEAPIILNTGYPGDYSKEQVTREQQPFDYIGKNEDPKRLQTALSDAVEFTRLRTDPAYLMEHARKYYGMVGRSESMLEIFRSIEQMARSDGKVMIFGDTGTGKNMVAKAIHSRSARAKEEFRTYSCSSKETDIVKSDLFGHIKGAYTGAFADRKGLFEVAHKGTVFLDEIADLDLNTQGRLLDVLESKVIQRVGSSEIKEIDVRVICATNKNLERAVAEGRFREDLYFRLWGKVLQMPRLKERREDILSLVDYFTEKYCHAKHKDMRYFDLSARDLFVEYDWPGNVRKLESSVHSLIESTPSYVITRAEVEKILEPQTHYPDSSGSLQEQLTEFTRVVIIKSLERHNYNVSKVARELVMDPSNLRRLIRRYGITLSI